MKKKAFLMIAFCSIRLATFGQEAERQIASEVCVELTKLDLKRDPEWINTQTAEIFRKVYAANDKRMFQLYQNYVESGKTHSTDEARQLVGQEIMVNMMKDCQHYQRITMFNYGPVPTVSKTAQKVGEAFTKLLIEKSRDRKIDEDLVYDCITEVSVENYDLIEEEFGDWSSQEFRKEFEAYLMTKCEPYIRWTASMAK